MNSFTASDISCNSVVPWYILSMIVETCPKIAALINAGIELERGIDECSLLMKIEIHGHVTS